MQRSPLIKTLTLFALVLYLCACNPGDDRDTKAIAEEVNDKKLRDKNAERDAQFLVDATSTSLDNTRLADVALTNGTGNEIKKISRNIKEANVALVAGITNIAGRKAITLPTEGSEKTLKEVGAIVDKAGKDFNKQWLEKARQLHAKQLQTFEDASGNATDSTIRAWFQKNLPTIQQQKATMDSAAMRSAL